MAPADARNQRANGIIEPNDDNTWTARHETVNSSISLSCSPLSLSIYIYIYISRVTRVIFTILQLSKQPNSTKDTLDISSISAHYIRSVYLCSFKFPIEA